MTPILRMEICSIHDEPDTLQETEYVMMMCRVASVCLSVVSVSLVSLPVSQQQ